MVTIIAAHKVPLLLVQFAFPVLEKSQKWAVFAQFLSPLYAKCTKRHKDNVSRYPHNAWGELGRNMVSKGLI